MGEQCFIDYFSGCVKNKDNYKYDVDYNGQHLEIKTTTLDSTYWKIKESTPGVPVISYFLKNTDVIDFIALLYINDEYDVYLKYIADAKTFSKYMEKSQGSGWYYNHHKAIADNVCTKY